MSYWELVQMYFIHGSALMVAVALLAAIVLVMLGFMRLLLVIWDNITAWSADFQAAKAWKKNQLKTTRYEDLRRGEDY